MIYKYGQLLENETFGDLLARSLRESIHSGALKACIHHCFLSVYVSGAMPGAQ